MEWEMLIGRLLHVLAGAYWAGVAIFSVLFLSPAITRTGPEGQSVMREQSRAAIDRRIVEAASLIREGGGMTAIGAIAAHVELSERQLQRRFLDGIGVSPKAFARIVRFQHALRLRNTGTNWLNAALEAGYYDQAHMINEIRTLTGHAPAHAFEGPPSALARFFNFRPGPSGFAETIFL